MSGRGRKRGVGNGASSATSIMQQQQQQHGQVRQGSSFWTCPACNTAVHSALTAFHISSCPVVAAGEVAPMKKTMKPPEDKQREGQGTEQSASLGSPNFRIVGKRGIPRSVSLREEDEDDEFSIMRRGGPWPQNSPHSDVEDVLREEQPPKLGAPYSSSHLSRDLGRARPWPKNPSVCEDLDEEDVLREAQPPKCDAPVSSSHFSMDLGSKEEKLLSCPHPETPIQEGRDRIGVEEQMAASPSSLTENCVNGDTHSAEVRKRLFEDWGQKLSPERPELDEQHSPSPSEGAAAAGSPCLVSPQAKRPRVTEFDGDESRMVVELGFIDSDSIGGYVAEVETLPFVDSIHDSQQERQEYVVQLDRTEESPQELEKELETDQKLQADSVCSLETAAGRIGDGFSQREFQLQNVIRELREKCAGAVIRETKLQETLDLKIEECERLHKSQQELQSELLSVRGQLETTLHELRDTVDNGQRKSANEIHMPDQSATQVYKEDESMPTQLLSQTSNTPASCSNSPRATEDDFAIARGYSANSQNLTTAQNAVETVNDEQATQLLSDGFVPGCSPGMDEADENFQASAEFRRVRGSCVGPSDVATREPTFSEEAAPGKVDGFLARRLFDGGTTINNGILNDNFSIPLPYSVTAVAALAPHTPGKALLKPAGEHEEKHRFGGHDNSNLGTMGNQRTEVTPGGGPKTPENFAVMLGAREKGLISEILDNFPPAQGIETHVGIDPFDDHFRHTTNETTSNVPSASKEGAISMEDGQTFLSDGVGDSRRLNECKPPASPQASENSLQETFGEIGPKKKRRKAALVIDSDSDEGMADENIARGGGDPRKDRQLFSRPSVNVILSSDEEEDIGGQIGKRRRLVKVQESTDRTKTLQPDPDSEGTKETSTEVSRRSQRLRNVYISVPKEGTLPTRQDEEIDSDCGRSDGLGTGGHVTSSKPHVLSDDDDIIEIDSDSSDGRPTRSLHKLRKDIAAPKHRSPGAQRALFSSKQDAEEEEDDIETDDSGFINDGPESDIDACSSVDEISDYGEESENDGSSASGSSSDGRKKYSWALEGEMLAALAKDPELCLRGLCAVYRRQEDDEKISASSKYINKRGFSKLHSARASSFASFLMGDTDTGPVVKTVKELKGKFDEDAVTYCSDVCSHYSKQLFEIYQNDEDPYFPEPYTSPVV